MKKKYQIPTTETISLGTTEVMVPNEMSNPSVGGANTYVLEEEEEEQWGTMYSPPDISENKLWN